MNKLLWIALLGGAALALRRFARQAPRTRVTPSADAHASDALDQALMDSFPASDPPAMTMPHAQAAPAPER